MPTGTDVRCAPFERGWRNGWGVNACVDLTASTRGGARLCEEGMASLRRMDPYARDLAGRWERGDGLWGAESSGKPGTLYRDWSSEREGVGERSRSETGPRVGSGTAAATGADGISS